MDGFELKLEDNSELVKQASQEQILRALTVMGETAEGYAKTNCPVDTGRLRASIAHVVDTGNKCTYIGTNVEYAPYVEFGTGQRAEQGMGGNQSMKGMKAQPYLRPAVANHAAEYKAIIEGELKS